MTTKRHGSGTEAAPCEVCNAPSEIAGGEHVCGLSASAAYSLGFARGINSQAAASPEGEGREALSYAELDRRYDICRDEIIKLRHELEAALRQSAAPSGGATPKLRPSVTYVGGGNNG